MKIVVQIVLTVTALFMALPASAQSAVTDQGFDIACAAASGLQMTKAARGSPDFAGSARMHFFYLGRLSLRDDKTDWPTVLKERMRNPEFQQSAPKLIGLCVEYALRKTSAQPPR